jgi:hypothetical protein
MDDGITVETVWFDNDVIELSFRCSNRYFSGCAKMYAAHEAPSELANALVGFPSSKGDTRNFELGTFDRNYAGGGVRMHFHCLDSAGHAAVDIKLREHGCEGPGEVHSVALRIRVEAAGIDEFVRQLKAMKVQTGATASLRPPK